MAWICPTVTATTKEEFKRQLKAASKLARRVHLDVSDKTMAPRELLGLGQMRWDSNINADVHVMSGHPHAEILIACEMKVKPQLVIIHAEAKVDFLRAAGDLRSNGINAGVALLPSSSLELIEKYIHAFQHVLIFSGNLGYQGGSLADLALLDKVRFLREHYPKLEIGWDGGVNDSNIYQLAHAGVTVINVGGYFQHAREPKKAYAKLELALKRQTYAT